MTITELTPTVWGQEVLNCQRDDKGRAFHTVEQGSPEWLSLRLGLITASEAGDLITPTFKLAQNQTVETYLHELAAQRITNYGEPRYVSSDMLRGHAEEAVARRLYSENIAKVEQVGFITRKFGELIIGASPDGLVGEHGMIEVKSRLQKYQVETVLSGKMPAKFVIQTQMQMLVAERNWCDFISICGGMPLFVWRVNADFQIQQTILQACAIAEGRISEIVKIFKEVTKDDIKTERLPEAQDSEIL